MFRLNGDIVKQLEDIYHIKFHQKYRNELKNRIFSFVNSFIFNLNENDFLIKLSLIQKDIIIHNNSISILSSSFIEKYKEEIFNSFNPLWYSSKEPNQKLTILEKEQMFNQFFIYISTISIKNVFNKFNITDIINNSTNDFDNKRILKYRTFNEQYYFKLFNRYYFKRRKTNKIFKLNKSILSNFFSKHDFYKSLDQDIEDFYSPYTNLLFNLNNSYIPLLIEETDQDKSFIICSANYNCYQLEDFICSLILKETLFQIKSFFK